MLKSETEFNLALRHTMQCTHRRVSPNIIASKMGITPSLLYAYKGGYAQMTLYQFYLYTQASGMDENWILSLFRSEN